MLWKAQTAGLLLVLMGTACHQEPPQAHFLREISWSLGGYPLIADLHSHTRFSDGALTPEALADKAAAAGCRVLAITDHGDLSVPGLSPVFFSELARLRKAHPELLVLSGLEWNIPPYNGREHVGVLVPPAAEETVLPQFRQQFEQNGAEAVKALQWLAGQPAAKGALMIYNHPSRKDREAGENLRDLKTWRGVNDLFAVIEGGPGHQRAASPGDYQGAFKTIERWDPAVAEVGGTWDQWLASGEEIWGALADSDFHNDELDEAPCGFARTHLHVPVQTPAGVLRALRAGDFWADHGQLLGELSFQVDAAGLAIPAIPGEAIAVPETVAARVLLNLKRGPGGEGRPLRIQVVGNGKTGQPALWFEHELKPDENQWQMPLGKWRVGADGHSAYLRVVVRGHDADGAPLLAYSNPIRLVRE